MRRLLPPTPEGPARDDLTDDELVDAYRYPADVSWLRANMVVSVDGVASLLGLSEGLSGSADKRVFFLLRALADVVLVGAGTARAEDYGGVRVPARYAAVRESLGQAPVPPIAIVSRSLGLDPGARVFTENSVRPLIITCASAPADRQDALADVADLVVVGETEVDLGAARAALEGMGLSRMLCEGGPALLRDLVGGSVLDELCLTTSPLVVGGGERHLLTGPPLTVPRPAHLSSLLEDDGVLLARYVLERR